MFDRLNGDTGGKQQQQQLQLPEAAQQPNGNNNSSTTTTTTTISTIEHSIRLLDRPQGYTDRVTTTNYHQEPSHKQQNDTQQDDDDDDDSTLEDGNNQARRPPNISDLIGEFGLYQLSLALITMIRYVCVAMMTNTGALLAPSVTYWCVPPPGSGLSPTSEVLRDVCTLQLRVNGTLTTYTCTSWTYDRAEFGVTLTDSFDLVCERSWLRSTFQSAVSLGVVVASVLFGSFSDEHGRRLSMLASAVVALAAGLVSCWAPNFLSYTLARMLCTMCDLGLVGSLYTTVVETLGNKYRGPTCLIVFTGWSLGVMVMPWITGYFRDFRQVMLFTVGCHLATLPWLLSVGESVRWLLVNGRLAEARQEMRRICGWNSGWRASKRQLLELNVRFDELQVKYELMAREREDALRASGRHARYNSRKQVLKRTLCGGLSKVGQIFSSRELTIASSMIIWTTFNSELLYMLFIMINSDVGDNVKLNYAIGGLVETLATLLSIVMIMVLTRRLSLCSVLTTISLAMVSLAFTHAQPSVSVWTLNFAKLAISTLSSLVYVVVTELYPTSLRQTGMGLAGTLGSLGATIAPFIRSELVDAIGMTSVMLALSLLPLSAALLIPFFLRETRGVELADDVNDLEPDSAPSNGAEQQQQQQQQQQQSSPR